MSARSRRPSSPISLSPGSLRLRLQLVRRGEGCFLGTDVLEQHAAILEIFLGQASAGSARYRRDRSTHARGVAILEQYWSVMVMPPNVGRVRIRIRVQDHAHDRVRRRGDARPTLVGAEGVA